MITKPLAQPASLPSVVSANVTCTFPSQLSFAVTLTVAAAGKDSPHAAAISAGTPSRTGASESSTVISWVASTGLPHASAAFQVLTNT